MKTLTIWNVETGTNRTIEVSEDFFSFIEKRHKKWGFIGDPAQMSEEGYVDYKKSYETINSQSYKKWLKKMESIFRK